MARRLPAGVSLGVQVAAGAGWGLGPAGARTTHGRTEQACSSCILLFGRRRQRIARGTGRLARAPPCRKAWPHPGAAARASSRGECARPNLRPRWLAQARVVPAAAWTELDLRVGCGWHHMRAWPASTWPAWFNTTQHSAARDHAWGWLLGSVTQRSRGRRGDAGHRAAKGHGTGEGGGGGGGWVGGCGGAAARWRRASHCEAGRIVAARARVCGCVCVYC